MAPKIRTVVLSFLATVALITTTAVKGQQNASGDLAISVRKKANNVLWYKGFAANPLLIDAFMPLAGERPVMVSFNFLGGHNRFFIEHPIDSTTADLPDGKGRFSYTLLGQTANGIYVVQAAIVNN